MGILFTLTLIVEINATIIDDTFNKIGGWFDDMKDQFSDENLDDIKSKVEEQIKNLGSKINSDDLKNKIENVFNDAKNDLDNLDADDLKTQVDDLIQEATAGIDWNTGTPLKLSFFTIITSFFYAYLIC